MMFTYIITFSYSHFFVIMCLQKQWDRAEVIMKKKCIYILMICLLVCGCTSKKEEVVVVDEKPIQIALTQDMLSFDPMMTNDIYSEAILRCVYTTLYDFDENLMLQTKLVKEDKMIDDFDWEFEIHSDVTFQNGDMLTSDDVVFSIERARKGGRTAKMLEIIEAVEKIDDTHFSIRTRESYSDLPTLFAKAETSIVSKKVVEKEGYDFSNPVGSGPFKFVSWLPNEKIELERYDDYFLEPAASKYLNFVILVTEQERTAAFLNGAVDILFSVSAYDCEKLRLSQGVNILQQPSSKIEYLSLNTQHPPLDDKRVRQAISYAIKRDAIAENVYRGYSTSSVSLIPSGVIGHLEPPITYNPEKAKELLAEAGYSDGFSFNVITIDTIRKNTLEYIKLDLAQVGITLNYNLVTMKEAVEMMNAGEHDSILVGWAFSSDPNGVLPTLLGTGSGKTQNSSNYSNPEFDALLKEARAETDREKTREIYEQANAIVSEDSPIVILQNPMILSAARDDIEAIQMNSQGLHQYETIYRK